MKEEQTQQREDTSSHVHSILEDIEAENQLLSTLGFEAKTDINNDSEKTGEQTSDSFTKSSTETQSTSLSLLRAQKPVLFVDLDDVLLTTNETLLTLLNTHFELYGEDLLVLEDVKEWNYFSILEKINNILKEDEELQERVYLKYGVTYPIGKEYIIKLLDTSDFWVRLSLPNGLEEMLDLALEKYEVMILTQGSFNNLTEKFRFLQEKYGLNFFEKEADRYCQFIGLNSKANKNDYLVSELCQAKVKNRLTIQVDDNYDNLNNLCDLKILLKNGRETDYNKIKEHREDIYVCNNLREVKDIIDFYSKFDYRDIGKDNIF